MHLRTLNGETTSIPEGRAIVAEAQQVLSIQALKGLFLWCDPLVWSCKKLSQGAKNAIKKEEQARKERQADSKRKREQRTYGKSQNKNEDLHFTSDD